MTELLTAAQMRAIEQAAIASGEVTGLELMERAGRGVVEAIFAEWPALRATSHRAVILCGPGNNGGDGFVVARLLKEWGWEVEVFLYGSPDGMPPDARVNHDRWVGKGKVKPFPEGVFLPGCDVLVDAVFGTGLSKPLPEEVTYVIANQHRSRGRYKCVSIDIPSGLCADSGKELEICGRSDLTVTFHRAKIGHYIANGASDCGKVVVKDIGLPVKMFHSVAHLMAAIKYPSRVLSTSEEIKEQSDRSLRDEIGKVKIVEGPNSGLGKVAADPFRRVENHKFSHGHALILSGPPGHGGAARMTARGALRIGAGLVTLACPPEALPENAARLDAIMLKTVADGAGLTDILSDPRITALCLGPGLGLDDRAADLVKTALVGRGSRRLCLTLDADALTLIARDPTLFALLHPACILTPHHGEFARLFPDIAALLDAPATTGPAYSKVDATRAAAARAGCTVLYKGPDTVIASPKGTCAINSAAYDRAAPWLATAGSGDVLAGFITGLLARGFAPQQSAETAAWLHVECARSFGPGLIAEDLPEELPKVFRALGL